jgi:hypothetical protein
MRVAVGGDYEESNRWVGSLITPLRENKRERSFNISIGRASLDVLQTAVDGIHSGTSDPNSPTWSETEAESLASGVRNMDSELVFIATPGSSNDHLGVLFEPVTDIVIVTQTEDADCYTEWEEIAREHGLTITHHIITAEDGGPSYWTTDQGVVKVRVLTSEGELEDGVMRSFPKEMAADRVAMDLAKQVLNQ